MILFGITGGSGAGKTTALNALRELGAEILDTDAIYHALLRSCKPMREELTARFGDIWRPDGDMDRKKLGSQVFQDKAALEQLNAITHKYIDIEVTRRVNEARTAGLPAAAIDAILLLESGLGARCDCNVGVLAPLETRIARIMARDGISREYAVARIAAQQPDSFYREHCDYILCNDKADPAQFQTEARALFSKLIEEHAKHTL